MAKKIEPQAPRFHALWERLEGQRIFILKKSDWEYIKGCTETPFVLDLEEVSNTPFESLSENPNFLGATAYSTGESITLKIFRKDPKDFPTPYNVDEYTLWQSFPPDIRLIRDEMIMDASTNADANFLEYQEEHIFIVKENPGEDHWLEDLPPYIYAQIDESE